MKKKNIILTLVMSITLIFTFAFGIASVSAATEEPYEFADTTIVNKFNTSKEYTDKYLVDGAEVTEDAYIAYRDSHPYSENISQNFVKEKSRTLVSSDTVETGREDSTDADGNPCIIVYYTQTDTYDLVNLYERVHEITSQTTPDKLKAIDFVAISTVNRNLKKGVTPSFTAEIIDLTYDSGAKLRDRISVAGEKWTGPNTLEKGSDAQVEAGTYSYEITIKAAANYFFDGDFEFYYGGRQFDLKDLDITYPDTSTAVIKGFIDDVTITDGSGGGGDEPVDPDDPDINKRKFTKIVDHDNVTKQYVDVYTVEGKTATVDEYNTFKENNPYKEHVDITFVKELSRTLTNSTTTFTGTTQSGEYTIYNYTQDDYYDVVDQYKRTHSVVLNKDGSSDGQSTDPSKDPSKQEGSSTASEKTGADAAEKMITTSGKEDVSGATFSLLRAKQASVKKTSIKISWSKVAGATRYIVYGNKCGKANKYKKLAELSGKSFTQKGLKKGKYYKYLVVATNSKGDVLAGSKSLHIGTKGGKAGNPTKVICKKAKALKVGKTLKLKAKQSGSKVKKHRKVSYESSNPAIATVSSSGKVKAKAKGTCYIYAYAQNGKHKKVKITVH